MLRLLTSSTSISTAYFNDSEERSLLRDACLCSTLSLMGSIFVLASWYKFRSLQVFAFRLIAYLALADIGTDTAYLMGDQATGTTKCTVQGVMRIYFNLVAIFLTTVIANLMYQVIVERNFDIANQQAQRPTYMLYAWGLPVLFALLPFSTNNYGNNGAWCSITSSSGSWWGGVLWHVVCLYGPCWAAIAYNITMYLRVHQFVRGLQIASMGLELTETQQREMLRQQATRYQFVERLQLYPLVLVVSWTWATIYYVLGTISGERPLWLATLGYSMSSLMGFLNMCVYVATPTVWKAWVQEAQQSALWNKLPLFIQRRLGAASTTGEGRHAAAYGAFDLDAGGGGGGERGGGGKRGLAAARGREDAVLLGGSDDDEEDKGVFTDTF